MWKFISAAEEQVQRMRPQRNLRAPAGENPVPKLLRQQFLRSSVGEKQVQGESNVEVVNICEHQQARS